MRESTIAAGFAGALMELAVRKGASRKALAERSGIDPEELQDQDNRIPLERYIALMWAGKDLANDPALALHFGEAYDMAELSIVALIGQACETIADGVAQLERFGRLMIDVEVDDPAGRRLVLSRENGQLWLIDTRKNPNEYPEITESSIARVVCGSRRMSGAKPLIKEVHVTHAAPAWRAEYDRILQPPVVFGSDRNAMLLTGDSFLTLRNPLPSRYVFGILSARAETLLNELESSKTTKGRVESLLVPILHIGAASMDAIAREMGISRQTLFRKLKGEGTSFEKVLDKLHHKMALNYLSGKKVSVNETAYLVDFSESPAFSRAFKRWTGTSPRATRQQSVA